MPIGISGSGKSRLYRMKYSHLPVVCPDKIRQDMCGDISDQSRNDEVFTEVNKRIDELVKSGRSFFYDATNLNPFFRKEFVEKYRGTDVKITYVVLPADINTSMERIENDILNNVDRSIVPYSVLMRQMNFYDISVKSGFEGENVQEIIYVKQEELN